jgi:uncharacterized protein YjiS (DUF1127 family)
MSDRMILRLPFSAIAGARDRTTRGGLTWENIRAAWRRYRSRQRISELDGHILKDIGVTFAEAENEANKPFWR